MLREISANLGRKRKRQGEPLRPWVASPVLRAGGTATRASSVDSHIRMMTAVQPSISGAISLGHPKNFLKMCEAVHTTVAKHGVSVRRGRIAAAAGRPIRASRDVQLGVHRVHQNFGASRPSMHSA
jgi:hypothetical protein